MGPQPANSANTAIIPLRCFMFPSLISTCWNVGQTPDRGLKLGVGFGDVWKRDLPVARCGQRVSRRMSARKSSRLPLSSQRNAPHRSPRVLPRTTPGYSSSGMPGMFLSNLKNRGLGTWPSPLQAANCFFETTCQRPATTNVAFQNANSGSVSLRGNNGTPTDCSPLLAWGKAVILVNL